MRAMLFDKVVDLELERQPLKLADVDIPKPAAKEILIKVNSCGVCHTELDEIEGRTKPSAFPMIPGHEVVGEVVSRGEKALKWKQGDRVGVGWFYSSCGECAYCTSGRENLCKEFLATGRDRFGGYAEYMLVPENSAYAIPESISSEEASPLLCAGGVGFRSLRLSAIENGAPLGLAGFGASNHLVFKAARVLYPDSPIFIFARSRRQRDFALELGADWVGDFDSRPPQALQSIIDTTPAWHPVLASLERLRPGGRLVINAIRKEDKDKELLTSLDYSKHLWMEKEIKSVANVSPRDLQDFLKLAGDHGIRAEVQSYELEDANRALMELKRGNNRGAKVLRL